MKKILIVDDEPDILKVVQFRLKKSGYEIFVATNGKEGLEMAKKIKPDLMMLDFSMPLMKGDEVCKLLREDPVTKNIAVILMTASSHKVESDAFAKIGANDGILKPFEPEEMLEKVKKYIG